MDSKNHKYWCKFKRKKKLWIWIGYANIRKKWQNIKPLRLDQFCKRCVSVINRWKCLHVDVMEGQPYTVATSHQLYSKGIATNQNILATTPNNTFAPRTSISSDPTSNYLPFLNKTLSWL